MNDKIRLLMPCEIPNLEKYVDIALIESELETYTSNPQLSSSASFLRLNVLSSLN